MWYQNSKKKRSETCGTWTWTHQPGCELKTKFRDGDGVGDGDLSRRPLSVQVRWDKKRCAGLDWAAVDVE